MQPKQAPQTNASRFAGLGSKVLFGLLLLPVLLTCASAEINRAGMTGRFDGGNGGGSEWIYVRPNQLAIATVAVPYSAHLVAQGGTPPYRFAFTEGSIPPGLYFNNATGTVAGTPSTAGSFNFQVMISDATKVDRNPVTIYMIVNPANPGSPAITVSVSPSSASVASAGTQQFSAVVAHASNTAVTWTASTGTISSGGTFTAPSVTVATTARVTATSVADPSKRSQSTITVNPLTVPVSVTVSPISSTITSAGTQQFSATVRNTSNTAVLWSAAGGTISSSGMFTAPSVSVPTTATVIATSVADRSKHAQSTISVNPLSVPVSVVVSPTSSTITSAGTQQFTATVRNSSNTAVVWTASSGTINSGGMFTAPSVTASTTATITATSAADATKFAHSVVTINPAAAATVAVSVSPNSAALTSGNSQQFNALVTGTSNTAVTWSATSGTVSSGGMFTAPSVSTSTNLTVTATSVADPTKRSSASVVVSPGTSALSITTSALPGGQAGTPYGAAISAIGGSTPYQWSIASGSLPQGLTLTSSGQLSGTPTQIGQFSFAVQVTDAGNTTVRKTLAVAVLLAQRANYDGPAELPRVYMLTTMADTPAPGTTTLVSAGGNLQTALNNANCGDTIELAAGATFSGQFTLPAKPCTDQNWIIVRTSAPDSSLPPEGSRMTPCYAGVSSLPGRPSFNCSNPSNVLAKVVYAQTGGSGPFQLASGANHYRLMGLEITRTPGTGFIGPLITTLGPSDHLVVDRVWLHGAPSDETLSGMDVSSINYAALVDSYATDFHCTSATGSCTDAHDISGGLGSVVGGPYRIVGNFLEAAGENVMFGGGGATATPADVEIRLNHFFKPWTWMAGQPGFVGGSGNNPFMVKNHLELKNAQRVLIEGNIFENNWGGFSQAGYSVLLTPKNQAGTNGANLCPICAVTDVTIRYNTISHVGGGISMADVLSNNNGAALAGERYSIHDVTIDDVSVSKYRGNGNLIMVFSQWVTNSLNNISINHVTGFPDPSATFLMIGNSTTAPPMYGFVMNNSIVGQSQYPVWSTGGTTNCAFSNVPLTSLNTCFPAGYAFTHNALIGVNQGNYPTSKWPAGNYLQSTATTAGFVNFNGGNGGNYQLLSSSPYSNAATDGKDLGADVSMIQSQIANVY